MHMFVPKPAAPDLPMFFNVDQSVGHLGANARQEDILLVQFMIRKIAEVSPAAPTPEGQQRKLRALLVPLSGVCDEATIDGIRAWQEANQKNNPGTVVDGLVNPARGYSYGPGFWTIVKLNASMRFYFRNVWPRLQDLPGCPPALAQRVYQIL